MSTPSLFGFNVPVAVLIVLIVLLIVLAGTMAGLILCIFSLDVNRLNAILKSQNVHEAAQAKRVLMILDKPHWLLITLIVWNDIALEALPVLLHMLLNPLLSIVVSVVLVLIFGEIIPQSVFIHHAFSVAAFLAPFVLGLMWLTAPIAWPLGKLLDVIVGSKDAVFSQRQELHELIRYQEELRERMRGDHVSEEVSGTLEKTDSDEWEEEELTKEEMTIMLNVLSLSDKKAQDMVHIPIEEVYKLHVDSVITQDVIETVFARGYYFVAIYENASDPSDITSVFLTRSLLLLVYRRLEDCVRVKDLPLVTLARLNGDLLGTEVFIALQNLSPAIAAVVDEATKHVVGILTLHDVTEIIHQTTFKDEMDPSHQSPMQLILTSWPYISKLSLDVNYLETKTAK